MPTSKSIAALSREDSRDHDVVHPVESNDVGEHYETTELRSRFSVWSTIGINFSLLATPMSVITYISLITGVGGSPFFIYCYITAAVGQLLVCTSMAEVAAVFPHVSGQVYWTAALAPKGWAKPLSYFNAGCTTIAWIFVSSGSFIVSAEVVLASVPLTFPAYEEKYWHVFLVATAVALVCVAWNTVLFDLYPWLSKFLVVFINASGLYIIIGLLARTTPKASARTVFVDIINETGWDTAVVFFIGLIPGLYSVALFDLASHLTEELPNPRKQVPQIMMWTGLLAALSGVPMVIVCCFCTYDPLRLLTPIGGQAAFQIFVDGFRSFGMTMLAAVMFDIVWIFVAPSAILTTSRVLWSLARHKAWPLGKYIGYVQAKHQIPVGAVWLSTILALIVGLIGFGSTTVVNGCFGAAGVLFVPSYGMPFWLLLIRGRSVLPAKRYFNLGRWGPAVNVLAMGWQAIVAVFLCFPLTNPAQLSNMNWASAASCVGLVFVGVNWFLYAAKHFEPPKALYLDHDLDRAD